jgi:glutamyl-tRNA synthetase
VSEAAMSEVRVRYAPSPTGSPHVGNIRVAIYDWLFARRHGGKFLLRIEDTDRKRTVPGGVEEQMEALRWLGLQWDEGPEVGGPYGPYIQSERQPIYQEAARRLVESGAAYPCFCTPERLQQMREAQQARKEPTRYDRRCRDLSPAEREAALQAGTPHTIRLAVPLAGETSFHDEVRGEITYQNAVVDDYVLLKTDGWPTYHLASVVDDHAMRISHVLRGDDWIATTPVHILLYRALGYPLPKFAHFPQIHGPDRARFGKRHGAQGALEYREQGYLPETMINFLALLGWAPGDDREIMSREEMVQAFDLAQVSRNPAIFDVQKLDWMNGVYIRQLPVEELVERALPFLQKAGLLPDRLSDAGRTYVAQVLALEQERLKRLTEAPELTEFFFREEPVYEEKAVRKWLARDSTPAVLQATAAALRAVEPWEMEHVEAAVRGVIERLCVNAGEVIHPVRVAATGRTVGPGLFETLAVLGRDRVLRRLEAAARMAEEGTTVADH